MSGPIWTDTITSIPNFSEGYQVGTISFLPLYTQNIVPSVGTIIVTTDTPPEAPIFQQGPSAVVVIDFVIISPTTTNAGTYVLHANTPLPSIYGSENNNPTFSENFNIPGLTYDSITTYPGSTEIDIIFTLGLDTIVPVDTPYHAVFPVDINTDDNTDE